MRVTKIIITLLLAFLKFQSDIECVKVNKYLQQYRNFIYGIHPLLLILENPDGSKISLLHHDKVLEDGSVMLTGNQRLMLSCPGYYNCLAMTKQFQIDIEKEQVPLDCQKHHVFPNASFNKQEIYDARCLSPMLGKVVISSESCANGKGVVVNVGFSLFDGPFLDLYTICFDINQTQSPIYTIHKIIGSRLLYEEGTLMKMPTNRINNRVMQLKEPAGPYFPATQEKMFRDLFGKKGMEYLKLRDYKGKLITGSFLTPPGDFYIKSMKTAIYVYENTIPVFLSIVRGNVRRGEIIGRILAVKLQLLKSITGSFGILQLPDDKGLLKPIYLNQEERNGRQVLYRPIPKFLYKIYFDSQSRLGIAFVTMNNPFFKFSANDFPCKDITKSFIDISLFSSELKAGFTICCSVNDLVSKVNHLKGLISVRGVLRLDVFNTKFPFGLLKLPTDIILKLRERSKLDKWSPGATLEN